MNQSVGYARVSTADQNADLQVELTAAGCHRIFVEQATGARSSARS
jgi:DNA invertase Pin-like site-specific DNA recombinase